jgi:uncharacterized protein with GYD domain
MALYLYQAAYTPESWAAMIANPGPRPVDIGRSISEQIGGRVIGVWFAFGEYDIVAVLEAPDNVNMAAAALKLASGGALTAAKTTPLLSIEDGIEAMQKAGSLDYSPPSTG